MANILIVISNNRMVRTFLDTYIFYNLVKTDNEIYILSHQKNIKQFTEVYSNVHCINDINIGNTSKIKEIFKQFYDLLWKIRKFPIESSYFCCYEKNFKFYVKQTLKILLCLLFIPFYEKLKERIWYNKEYEVILKKYKINKVFLPCTSLNNERMIGIAANKLGIPVIIGSDSCDAYYLYKLFIRYDKALVWGKAMVEMLKCQFDFSERKMVFIGIPFKESLLNLKLTKDEIKNKYGIKADEKVILMFSCGRYTAGLGEKYTVDEIEKAIKCGVLKKTRLLFRLKPVGKVTEWEKFFLDKYKNSEYVIIQIPSKSYSEVNSLANLSENHFSEVGELYKIADIMVNILSTSFLECNAVNPHCKIVMCNYNKRLYPTKYMEKTQLYKNFLEAGIEVVTDINELVTIVKKHIDDVEISKDEYTLLDKWDNKDDNVIDKLIK